MHCLNVSAPLKDVIDPVPCVPDRLILRQRRRVVVELLHARQSRVSVPIREIAMQPRWCCRVDSTTWVPEAAGCRSAAGSAGVVWQLVCPSAASRLLHTMTETGSTPALH